LAGNLTTEITMKKIAGIAACLAIGTALLGAADVKENWEKIAPRVMAKTAKAKPKPAEKQT